MSRPTSDDARLLRLALKPYISVRQLRRLAAQDSIELLTALLADQPPPEVLALIDLLSVLLRPLPRERIDSPEDVAALMMVRMAALAQEQLHVILLDSSGYLQAIEMIYQGTLTRAEVRPSEVFRAAMLHNSAAIILVHNHPSGDTTPSPPDIALTRHLKRIGKQLGIRVLDHLIIGKGHWVSLAEQGVYQP